MNQQRVVHTIASLGRVVGMCSICGFWKGRDGVVMHESGAWWMMRVLCTCSGRDTRQVEELVRSIEGGDAGRVDDFIGARERR